MRQGMIRHYGRGPDHARVTVLNFGWLSIKARPGIIAVLAVLRRRSEKLQRNWKYVRGLGHPPPH